jgi:hypothetical protein
MYVDLDAQTVAAIELAPAFAPLRDLLLEVLEGNCSPGRARTTSRTLRIIWDAAELAVLAG